jgi:hypothetical protein
VSAVHAGCKNAANVPVCHMSATAAGLMHRTLCSVIATDVGISLISCVRLLHPYETSAGGSIFM